MDMDSPLLLTLSHHSGQKEKKENETEARFTRIEMHIAWLRRDVNDIRNELRDIRGEIKDVRGEVKDVRGEMKDIRKDMQTDFRLLFSALIGVALGLACIMAKGFHWL
ncbi:hypothetical protein [Erwinia sp. 198]|uniref:hypothetical protein n=1 Tax=Erwinia sp. 198 TaxID=2022746 RepID=UPI000F689C08|nr:hypothetical protein [Erwinia sp. 198]RRZ92829.1 hypothetical protein EGK14_08865 [Erwinia sp. 198]